MSTAIREMLLDKNIIRVQDVTDCSYCYINRVTGEKFKWSDNGITPFLPKEVTLPTFLRERSIGVYNVYKPNAEVLINGSGISQFNTWNPPAHYKADKDAVDVKLPQIYKDFFTHLFTTKQSRKYALDWMTQMLDGRNLTIFTMLGETQGTGKNTFARICGGLVGMDNYIEATDKIFTSSFNSELENKHCVLIDEVKIRHNDNVAMNRAKALINETFTVEGKGANRKTIPNVASYLLASNHLNAIPIEDTDRRFSVVDITDIPLINKPELYDQIQKEQHLTAENLMSLYIYLKKRLVDSKVMAKPFRGERFKQVVDALIPDWVTMVSDYLNGRTVELQQVKEYLTLENRTSAPGRRTLAQYFNVVDKMVYGTRTWMVSDKVKRGGAQVVVEAVEVVDSLLSLEKAVADSRWNSGGTPVGSGGNVVAGRFANWPVTDQDLNIVEDSENILNQNQA